jgi:hypothetical protein
MQGSCQLPVSVAAGQIAGQILQLTDGSGEIDRQATESAALALPTDNWHWQLFPYSIRTSVPIGQASNIFWAIDSEPTRIHPWLAGRPGLTP